MRNRQAWIVASALVVFAGLTGVVVGQTEEEMAAMAKLSEPGEHHAHLAKLVGNWSSKGKFWTQPGAPVVESEGEAQIRSTLGGRFFSTDFSGAFKGQEFTGFGLDGYDNVKKKHIGMWVDSMGTMMVDYEGDCSEGGKVTTVTSEFDDPMSGAHLTMRGVTTITGVDSFTYEAYMSGPEGNEFKAMEILYTRK